MSLICLPEDIIYVIAERIVSDLDLIRFSASCQRIYFSTKIIVENRKYHHHYATVNIDEELIYDFHLKHVNHKDWRAARYIQDILEVPRISDFVRTLKITENVALRVLKASINRDFLRYNKTCIVPRGVANFVTDVIGTFSNVVDERRQIWKEEALKGQIWPLCIPLLTLCPRLEILDLSHSSREALGNLLPLLEAWTGSVRQQEAGLTVSRCLSSLLPSLTELKLSKVTVSQAAVFFAIPTLRRMEVGHLDGQDVAQLDLLVPSTTNRAWNIEEFVIITTSTLTAQTLAMLFQHMSRIKRLDIGLVCANWAAREADRSQEAHHALLEHLQSCATTLENMTRAIIESRGLHMETVLRAKAARVRWYLFVGESEIKDPDTRQVCC